METYARAAYVVSPRNLEGSVVCRGADALPFSLLVGQKVFFVPPSLRGPRTAQVESVQDLREGSWLVHFSGVDNAEDAQAICGCYCLVPQEAMPELKPEDTPVLMTGWSVEDEAFGALGQIVDVLESPAQATLVVEGERGQVLIPFVDEFVQELDEGAQRVRVAIPESLLEL